MQYSLFVFSDLLRRRPDYRFGGLGHRHVHRHQDQHLHHRLRQLYSLPGLSIIKLFLAVIYECSYKARVFVPGKPFQLSLMFVSKIRSLPKVERLKGALLGWAPALLAKIGLGEKDLPGANVSLFGIFVNCSCKKFYNIGNRIRCLREPPGRWTPF
jgi:hypothetical protein